jgi:iron-sulfur cluster repair protein YtfE (RIC family)
VLPTLAGSPVIYVMRMWITPRAMEARSAVRTKLELVFGGAVREIPSALSFQKRLSQQSVCFHGKRNLERYSWICDLVTFKCFDADSDSKAEKSERPSGKSKKKSKSSRIEYFRNRHHSIHACLLELASRWKPICSRKVEES